MAIPAKYEKVCSNCNEYIELGDLITADGEDGPWVHEECA